MSTDLAEQQIGPVVAMNLGQAARLLIGETITFDELQNGRTENVNGVATPISGLGLLLRELAARFAPLPDESNITAMTDLMSFQRMSGETVDMALVRYETIIARAPA